MAQTTYQVILSTDGKHTVIATSDDVLTAKSAIAWAAATYDRIVELYGVKHEQHRRNGDDDAEVAEEEAPICQVHNVPMVRIQGKHGPFWSCHQRNPDGSFCSYRPSKD